MSLLSAAFGRERRATSFPSLDEVTAALSERRMMGNLGTPVTWNTSLRNVAVWSSVNFISDLIATLPWHTYRDRMISGKPVPIRDDTSARLVADPDPDVGPIAWRRQALLSALLRGNAMGLILARDRNMWPTRVRMTHPDDWSVSRVGKLDRPVWKYQNDEVNPDDIWRMTAYETPGSPVGMSPISHVAQSIGLGLSAHQFGSDFFADGAHPSAMLVTDQDLNDADGSKARTVKERFLESIRGREPAVLGGGWEYKPIQVAPEESQFLETIQANGAMVAMIFGLRPEDIGFKSGDSLTYANVEQRQIARLVYPVHGWVRRLEEALNRHLPRPQYVKANVDALVRVDTMTRYRAHDLAIRMGLNSVNERRELEDMPPADGGDERLWPPYRTVRDPEVDPGDTNAP